MTATAHGMSRASGAGGVAHTSEWSQESPPHNCHNADDNVDDFENARVSPAIAVAAAI